MGKQTQRLSNILQGTQGASNRLDFDPMSVTPGFITLWLYVASSGLMALLRNVKIHKNSYLKEELLISVLEISRTVSGYHLSHLQPQQLFLSLVWGTAFAVSGLGEARGGWLG